MTLMRQKFNLTFLPALFILTDLSGNRGFLYRVGKVVCRLQLVDFDVVYFDYD